MAKHSCIRSRRRHHYGPGGPGPLGCLFCGYKPPLPGSQEGDLQKGIVDFLTLEGWRVFEFNKPGAGMVQLPDGKWHSARGGTVPDSLLDLLAIRTAIAWHEFINPDGKWGPIYLHIEVKVPGKVCTPGQAEFIKWIRSIGGYAYELDGLDELARILVEDLHMKLRFYTLGKELTRG